jgi:hypothetical protein
MTEHMLIVFGILVGAVVLFASRACAPMWWRSSWFWR